MDQKPRTSENLWSSNRKNSGSSRRPGAQAADAVVVEPEPVEYVRVCDAYGAGFFYIPGTETCLQIGGYVRSTYTHLETEDDQLDTDIQTAGTQGDADSDEDTRDRWRTRARLWIDARNETDWGTLRSYVRFQANYVPGTVSDTENGNGVSTDPDNTVSNGEFGLVHGYIQLAGFRIGRGANVWNTNTGFGWVNASQASLLSDAGWFGSAGTDMVFDYTWAADGLSVVVGISSDSGYSGSILDADFLDFHAGVNYAGDGWGAAFNYVSEQIAGGDIDAWRAHVNVDLSEFIPGGTIAFNYMDSDTAGGGGYLDNAFTDQWQVGFQMSPTDNSEFFVTYSDGSGVTAATDGDLLSVGVNWYPVDGLKILASYVDQELAGVDSEAFLIGVRRSF